MRLFFGWCAATFVVATTSAQPGYAQPVSAPPRALQTGTAASSKSQPGTLQLSRRDAIAEALQHNAALDIASEQTAGARARRVTATSIPDPSATAAVDGITNPLRFGGAPSKPVGVELGIPFPDKFRLNARIGTADIRASEHNYRLQQQSIALLASAAYDSLLLARLHRSILLESRDLTADFLKRTEIRFTAGTAAKLDQIQAQVTVAQADNDLIANERDIANAQASLNRILGRTVSAVITPTDSFGIPAPLPDSSSFERMALANRPELAIVQEQRLGAKAATGLAKEFWLPDVTFAVGHDYATPGAALFTTGLAFPLPVFYWQHAKGDIAQARHYELELAATERDTRAQVIQDVRIAYANASTSIRQAIFIRDQLVPAAREAYRIASTSYALGGSSALEVLNARSALLTAQGQLADALADANTARADFERALGSPVSSTGATNR
ncbi:MAG: TolC family protein [Gemmatimonas sp.]